MFNTSSITGVLAFCLLLAGCDDGRPDRVPVSGRVLIDGRPLALGHIRFVPEGARPSSGQIGHGGRFTLSCFDGSDGAVPGRHRVEVSASEQIDSSSARWYVPKKYANIATSGLDVTITEPTDSLTIELTFDGGKPFVERYGN